MPPHQLIQLMYILTAYQRSSWLWNNLACAHANTSTVKYGGPASHPRKSQAARNRGAISAPGRPQSSFELCMYAFTGRDILCLLSHSSGQQMELWCILHISNSNSSKGHLLWTSSINWVREFNIAAESALHTSAHMYSIRRIPPLTQRN